MVTTISVRATIARLELGEQVEIPLQLRKSNSVRNCASVLGTDTGKRYSVSINRENQSCIVTRVR